MANLLRTMGGRHDLHWISLSAMGTGEGATATPGLARTPTLVPIRHNPSWKAKLAEALRPSQWRRTLERSRFRLRAFPQDAVRMWSPQLAASLSRILGGDAFDVVQIEYTAMGIYLPLIRRLRPACRVVLVEHDLSYLALQRRLEVEPGSAKTLRGQLKRMRSFETDLWERCDAVVTMSEVDRLEVLRHLAPEKAWTVPNGVDLEYFRFGDIRFGDRSSSPDRLLFLGSLHHPPNRLGLRFFLENVWPELRRRKGAVELHIVGEGLETGWQGFEGVRSHGSVDDVRPFLRASSLMVVPILYGSGTRLKILEAFAAGLPVVSTSRGCEGILAVAGVEVALADEPSAFVDAVVGLLENPEGAARMAQRARILVERLYSWESSARSLEAAWKAQ